MPGANRRCSRDEVDRYPRRKAHHHSPQRLMPHARTSADALERYRVVLGARGGARVGMPGFPAAPGCKSTRSSCPSATPPGKTRSSTGICSTSHAPARCTSSACAASAKRRHFWKPRCGGPSPHVSMPIDRCARQLVVRSARMVSKSRILVADVPAGQATLRNVMGDGVELVFATTVDAALRALPDADMVVCGIHFDDSRMFDLLRLCQADPHCRRKPIVCFRDLDSALAPTLFESLDIAGKALGATTFVDLFALKEKFGISQADGAFRDIILQCLARAKTGV